MLRAEPAASAAADAALLTVDLAAVGLTVVFDTGVAGCFTAGRPTGCLGHGPAAGYGTAEDATGSGLPPGYMEPAYPTPGRGADTIGCTVRIMNSSTQ